MSVRPKYTCSERYSRFECVKCEGFLVKQVRSQVSALGALNLLANVVLARGFPRLATVPARRGPVLRWRLSATHIPDERCSTCLVSERKGARRSFHIPHQGCGRRPMTVRGAMQYEIRDMKSSWLFLVSASRQPVRSLLRAECALYSRT